MIINLIYKYSLIVIMLIIININFAFCNSGKNYSLYTNEKFDFNECKTSKQKACFGENKRCIKDHNCNFVIMFELKRNNPLDEIFLMHVYYLKPRVSNTTFEIKIYIDNMYFICNDLYGTYQEQCGSRIKDSEVDYGCKFQLQQGNFLWGHYNNETFDFINTNIQKLSINYNDTANISYYLPILPFSKHYDLFHDCEVSEVSKNKYCYGHFQEKNISRTSKKLLSKRDDLFCVFSKEKECSIRLMIYPEEDAYIFVLHNYVQGSVRSIFILASYDCQQVLEFDCSSDIHLFDSSLTAYHLKNSGYKYFKYSSGYSENRCFWQLDKSQVFRSFTWDPIKNYYYLMFPANSSFSCLSDFRIYLPKYDFSIHKKDYDDCRKNSIQCFCINRIVNQLNNYENYSCRALLMLEKSDTLDFTIIFWSPFSDYAELQIIYPTLSKGYTEGIILRCFSDMYDVFLYPLLISYTQHLIVKINGLNITKLIRNNATTICKWSMDDTLAVFYDEGIKSDNESFTFDLLAKNFIFTTQAKDPSSNKGKYAIPLYLDTTKYIKKKPLEAFKYLSIFSAGIVGLLFILSQIFWLPLSFLKFNNDKKNK